MSVDAGKFIQGETTPDPKTWKANFRCAMNSLPDIKEVKDKSINRGSGAVRVYKMLNVSTKPNNKRSKAKDAKKNDKVILLFNCNKSSESLYHHL